LCFFFSSRRRHTRFSRDWSSDVCSSDLVLPLAYLVLGSLRAPEGWGLGNYRRLGTTGGANALTVTVWEAAANSLRAAVDATVIEIGRASCRERASRTVVGGSFE